MKWSLSGLETVRSTPKPVLDTTVPGEWVAGWVDGSAGNKDNLSWVEIELSWVEAELGNKSCGKKRYEQELGTYVEEEQVNKTWNKSVEQKL